MPQRFAFENGWVGAGWGLDGSAHADAVADGLTDTDAYETYATLIHPSPKSFQRALRTFAGKMTRGDFCWVYDSERGNTGVLR